MGPFQPTVSHVYGIWNLPYRSHRALTHKTASLQSIYNLVYIRCGRLLQAAKLSPSVLVQHVFLSAALHPWCFLGYNHLFGFRHVRSYCNSDCALADTSVGIYIYIIIYVCTWMECIRMTVFSSELYCLS